MPNVRMYTEALERESPSLRLAAEADALADLCLAYDDPHPAASHTPPAVLAQARRVKNALYAAPPARAAPRRTPAFVNAMLIIGFAAGALGAALALREGAGAATRPIAIGMGIGLALGYALGRWTRRSTPSPSGRGLG